ncbi:ABC transporter ATP-binding protein [Halalkalicoccus subterraneus]|uniref:ABC transporter ATP-binding protein n=1 Tax=Halalkalicoccus subterraneus TaxID=2675002 RepID=UPI000EFB3C14|nr:ABC transporter ATP-binding protein [Halalkalicoccus subterraneus]
MAVGDADDPFEEQRAKVDDSMRRLFRRYGSDNSFEYAVAIVASVLARLLDLIPPLMLGVAIDAIFNDSRVFSLGPVPASWLPSTQEGQFALTVAIIAGSFAVGAVFHWLRNWGWNASAQNITHEVRVDTYERMQRLGMEFFSDKQTGELMSILSNDVNQLERFLNDGLNSASRLIVMVIGVSVVLFTYNWQLALVALVPVPLIAGFTYGFISIIRPKYKTMRSTVGDLNSRLENNLGGIQVIKSSNTERYEDDRVDDASMEYFDANWDAIWTRIKFFPSLQAISGLGFALTFVVGGYWVFAGAPGPLTGELTLGTFVVFIQLSQQLTWPMAQFGQVINMYQRADASSARVFGLMDEPGVLADDDDLPDLAVEAGRVEYDDVTFGYDDSETIIEDVDFTVEPGETAALVGPTGAGKSTVLKLLLRMYDVDGSKAHVRQSESRSDSDDVDEGAIRIDGQDIRDVSLRSLRQSIGYVSQDTFLFYGTVRENIAYGTFNADDEAIVEAARAAEAHEFIVDLPDGYDTMVGERGVKLSGGQRQRVSIARAILKDPEILVLDEATSDVDTETEMLIQRSLDELTEDRTTFAIAHRLSTIRDAEQIVVLDDGRIVERGGHDELLENGGLYAHLWGVQAGEIDELPEEFIERAAKRQARTEAGDD